MGVATTFAFGLKPCRLCAWQIELVFKRFKHCPTRTSAKKRPSKRSSLALRQVIRRAPGGKAPSSCQFRFPLGISTSNPTEGLSRLILGLPQALQDPAWRFRRYLAPCARLRVTASEKKFEDENEHEYKRRLVDRFEPNEIFVRSDEALSSHSFLKSSRKSCALSTHNFSIPPCLTARLAARCTKLRPAVRSPRRYRSAAGRSR
jgi:hypothetical protein